MAPAKDAAARAADASGTDTQTSDTTNQGNVPFFSAGKVFTDWLNARLVQTSRPTITLGTKRAVVTGLRSDGALACEVDGDEVKAEPQTVALEPKYLDELLPQLSRGFPSST